VHHGRAPQVHRADLAIAHQARCRASRVPHRVFRYMQRSPTPPGPSPPHHNGVYDVAFRVFGARRHPGLAAISGLNTLPARSPVNASCLPLPKATHDSGPVWLAGPSLSGTCTLLHSAGFSRRLPERHASGAAESGSEARASAVSRRLHAIVRCSAGSEERPLGSLAQEARAYGQSRGVIPLSCAYFVADASTRGRTSA
jgi:hypothetical protein